MQMKVHIKYAGRDQQIVALRAQTLLVVSGITCSVDQKKKPGKSWIRIEITKGNAVVADVKDLRGIVFYITRLIGSLLALHDYAKEQ